MLFTYRMDQVFSFHQMPMAVDIPRAPGYLLVGQRSRPRVATHDHLYQEDHIFCSFLKQRHLL